MTLAVMISAIYNSEFIESRQPCRPDWKLFVDKVVTDNSIANFY